MTEQVSVAIMDREEFEEHHARTGQCIARVGKIWETVAEEQQAIVDGRGYEHLGYKSYRDYWTTEWEEVSGWKYGTIKKWMAGKRYKNNTPIPEGAAPPPPSSPLYDRLGQSQWRDLAALDPEQRAEFLERYEDEIKPKLQAEGVSENIFREGVKEFKGEREPIVRETLSPDDMANLPNPELTASEKWVYQAGRIVGSLRRLRPEEVAEDAYRLMPDKLDWEIDAANQIIGWYEQYKQALQAQKNQGLRAVK